MSEIYPRQIYGDPSNAVDTLRRLERKINNCNGCKNDGGTVWGQHFCAIGRNLDADGYCKKWEAKR